MQIHWIIKLFEMTSYEIIMKRPYSFPDLVCCQSAMHCGSESKHALIAVIVALMFLGMIED